MAHFYFDPNSRAYYPSVTTILHTVLPEPDGIRYWKLKNKNWEKDLTKSSDHGTLVHYIILNPLSDHTLDCSSLLPYHKWYPDTPEKLELSRMMFQEMLEREKITLGQPRRIESKIINPAEKYAGQIDLLCPINGKSTLLDIKTSSAIHEPHLLQLGGYYLALDPKPEQVGIIKVTPDPDKNPKLTADLHLYPASKAQKWGEEFVELARKYHAENMKPSDGKIEHMD